MRKRALKYPSELNTATVRISLGTYQLLTELAKANGKTIAETLDLVITSQAPETITVHRTRIPVTVIEAKPKLVNIPILSKPAISVNGDKRVAVAIRSKGGIIND